MAADQAGNIFVADSNSSTIRRVTPAGVVTTVAGAANVAGVVVGAAPRLAFPTSLAIVGDSSAISDNFAVLLLRHGAR